MKKVLLLIIIFIVGIFNFLYGNNIIENKKSDGIYWLNRLPVYHMDNGIKKLINFHALINFDDIKLSLSLQYKWPDYVTIVVIDRYDNTPLFLISQKYFLIYNILKEKIEVGRGYGNFSFFIDKKKESKLFLFAGVSDIDFEIKNFSTKNLINIDFLSIKSLLTSDITINKNKKNLILKVFSKSGNRMVAQLDPEREQPYTSIAFYQKGETIPVILVDDPGSYLNNKGHIIKFPWNNLLNSNIPMKKISGTSILALKNLLVKITQALSVRIALNNHQYRKKIENYLGSKINWNKLVETDKIISKQLRNFYFENNR